jgi:hypothetical protein
MRDALRLFPLQERIRDIEPEILDKVIESFSCSADPDVESFLKNKATTYERKGLSRTYLYVYDAGAAAYIVAYFTLAITATSFEGISKNRKEKVLGFKPGRNTKDHFGGILVGQLARADEFGSHDISGREIIEDAERVIEKGRYYLGGKIVYLDCKKHLIKLYQDSGYKLVVEAPYPGGYYKMFKVLPELL